MYSHGMADCCFLVSEQSGLKLLSAMHAPYMPFLEWNVLQQIVLELIVCKWDRLCILISL